MISIDYSLVKLEAENNVKITVEKTVKGWT